MSLGYIGNSLPAGWETPFLTDLVTPKQWRTISTKDLIDDGYIVYGANGKIGFYSEYTHEYPTLMITCRGATCGNLHISDSYSYINGNAMALDGLPDHLVDIQFLYYALKARGLVDTISGSAQPQITGQGLKKVRVPLPSFSEQKIIADKLDTLLAQVDNTKARLEQIPQILKRFRQAVLAAAVSGKLTEELWGTHVWRNFSIGQLAKNAKYSLGIGPFGSNLKVNDYKTEGHPLVFVRDIRSGIFGGVNTKYVNEDKFNELKAHRVKPGDVLITKMGDPPGDVAIYPLNQPEAIITSDCIKISLNESLVLTKFVLYTMMSEQFRAKVLSISAGVAQQKVNLKNFKNIDIDIPSLEEQTEIVRRVEQLFAYADGIEKQVQNALKRVNNLTQSILAKAFRGELTAQWRAENPDLISGENSAQALLAKIQQQRANTKTAKRGSSKR